MIIAAIVRVASLCHQHRDCDSYDPQVNTIACGHDGVGFNTAKR